MGGTELRHDAYGRIEEVQERGDRQREGRCVSVMVWNLNV